MKNLKTLMFGLALIMAFFSCQDDDNADSPGRLQINFAASYDNLPLVMNQVVDYDGSAMRINVSEFYVSEIQLSQGSQTVELGETEYVSFTGASGNAVSSLTFDDVPVGAYDQLKFYIGVPADLNQMKPEDFTSDQALSNSSTYWAGWESYIFSKLEGKLDTLGLGNTELTYIYHSGKDELYTEVIIPLGSALNIASGALNQLDLKVEHKTLFESGADYLDIKAKPTAHNANDLEYPTIILGNFKTGITLE